MRSTEVYRILRGPLAPWCKANGFKRTSGGMLGWTRPAGEKHLVFWFQCTQSGWESYAGSQFIVEFQLAPEDQPGALGPACRRSRLGGLLSDAQRESVRELQNQVIDKLVRPPPDYFLLTTKGDVAKWFLARFEREEHPYLPTHDVWLRYHDEEDVARWAELVLQVLPGCVAKMEAGA